VSAARAIWICVHKHCYTIDIGLIPPDSLHSTVMQSWKSDANRMLTGRLRFGQSAATERPVCGGEEQALENNIQ